MHYAQYLVKTGAFVEEHFDTITIIIDREELVSIKQTRLLLVRVEILL